MLNVWSFDEQERIAALAAAHLDISFAHDVSIKPVTLNVDKKGIDRHWTFRKNGMVWLVEYKTDWKAEEHENVFIETWSQTVLTTTVPPRYPSKGGALGWVYTCHAQMMLTYLPHLEEAVFVSVPEMRSHLSSWYELYDEKPSMNPTYKSWGLCVPVGVYKQIATQIRHVTDPGEDYYEEKEDD